MSTNQKLTVLSPLYSFIPLLHAQKPFVHPCPNQIHLDTWQAARYLCNHNARPAGIAMANKLVQHANIELLKFHATMQDLMMFLQKLPTSSWSERDIEVVLSRAYMWRASFDEAKSHLHS